MGTTDSVIISTGGLLVVPDTSFRQPVLAFEFIPTRDTVMCELSRLPNIFPPLVMRKNLLRPSCDRDVLTHLNEEFHYRCPRDAPIVSLPPFSLFEYLERYQVCFDVERFHRMPTDGDELQMRYHLGECCNMAVTGWSKWQVWLG